MIIHIFHELVIKDIPSFLLGIDINFYNKLH